MADVAANNGPSGGSGPSGGNGSGKYTGVKGYFLSVFDGIYTTLRGMQITAKYWNFVFSFKPLGIRRERPVTMQYPEVKPDVQVGYRGKHIYVKALCIACHICEKTCPVTCIKMDVEGKGKAAVVKSYKVDYTKCLFCNLCSEVCPVDCLWLGTQYDLTQYSREACMMELLDENNAELRMPEKAKAAKPPKPEKKAEKKVDGE